jgi:hypothetical protein
MVVAPVVQIMPKLHDLCASPGLPLPVDDTKVASPTNLCVVPDSLISGDQLEVNFLVQLNVALAAINSTPSARNLNALFAKEHCDLLTKMEVSCPRSGRAVACL